MKEHQFKPFDQVLVRDSNKGPWRVSLYSHLDNSNDHVCITGIWKQMIPYNEETKHLLGTTKPYEKPEPKVWQVQSVGYNNVMTAEELSNFIKGAVINNKDIIDFRIKYIGNN